jgi:hypothetical protein
MPAKPTAASPKHFPVIPVIFLAIVVVVAGLLTGWKLYNIHQVAADKARFAQAEKDIDELSKAVIAQVGVPASSRSEKFCSRPHMEFEKGPLSCDIDNTFMFGIESVDEASNILSKITNISTNKWKFIENAFSINSGSSDNFAQFDTDYIRSISYQQKNKKYISSTNMQCTESFMLYKSTEPPYGSYAVDTSSLTLKASLSCGDYAKIEHYPLKS